MVWSCSSDQDSLVTLYKTDHTNIDSHRCCLVSLYYWKQAVEAWQLSKDSTEDNISWTWTLSREAGSRRYISTLSEHQDNVHRKYAQKVQDNQAISSSSNTKTVWNIALFSSPQQLRHLVTKNTHFQMWKIRPERYEVSLSLPFYHLFCFYTYLFIFRIFTTLS